MYYYYPINSFLIWWRAYFCRYEFWRVLYKNGQETHLLEYRQAEPLSKSLGGGKLFIDYEYIKKKGKQERCKHTLEKVGKPNVFGDFVEVCSKCDYKYVPK